jgi:beta-phosphoglucomutase
MPIRAIVFDFDGVIADSEACHGQALATAAAALGLTIHDPNPAWYVGLGDTECFERIALANRRSLTPDSLHIFKHHKAAAFADLSRAGHIVPYPGALELVRAAAARMPIAVCSGSRRGDIEPILAAHDLLGLLATLVTADDVPRTKPDPAPYLLTAQRLNVPPADCLAIEDSPAGIAAARTAGCQVHAVCHNFPRERLSQAHHIHPCIADAAQQILT